MIEHEPQRDKLNPYPWFDITCGTRCSIIATVQIVPDGKPLEPFVSKPLIRKFLKFTLAQ